MLRNTSAFGSADEWGVWKCLSYKLKLVESDETRLEKLSVGLG